MGKTHCIFVDLSDYMNKSISNNIKLLTLVAMFTSSLLLGSRFVEAKEFSLFIEKNRIIYHESDRLQAIGVSNKKEFPILLQAKIEPETKTDTIAFIVTPPIFKLDPNQNIALKII